jgi:hypothetical protein
MHPPIHASSSPRPHPPTVTRTPGHPVGASHRQPPQLIRRVVVLVAACSPLERSITIHSPASPIACVRACVSTLRKGVIASLRLLLGFVGSTACAPKTRRSHHVQLPRHVDAHRQPGLCQLLPDVPRTRRDEPGVHLCPLSTDGLSPHALLVARRSTMKASTSFTICSI